MSEDRTPESAQVLVTHGCEARDGQPGDRVVITKSMLFHLYGAAAAGDDLSARAVTQQLEPEILRLLAGYHEADLGRDCCGYISDEPCCDTGEHAPRGS